MRTNKYKEPTIHLSNKYNDSHACCLEYPSGECEIFLIPSALSTLPGEPEQKIIISLNHEYMHHILHNFIGKRASKAWDWIYFDIVGGVRQGEHDELVNGI